SSYAPPDHHRRRNAWIGARARNPLQRIAAHRIPTVHVPRPGPGNVLATPDVAWPATTQALSEHLADTFRRHVGHAPALADQGRQPFERVLGPCCALTPMAGTARTAALLSAAAALEMDGEAHAANAKLTAAAMACRVLPGMGCSPAAEIGRTTTGGTIRCFSRRSLKYQFLRHLMGRQPSRKMISSSFGSSFNSCGSISGRRSSVWL